VLPIKAWLRLAFGGPERGPGIQRLAIPYVFNEGLGIRDTAIATTLAFLRIILGCLLFAVWGVLALWLWPAMGPHFWRWPVLVFVLALFLSSILALMISISMLANAVALKRY